MKLVVTADLHYDVDRSVAPAERTAAKICGTQADALLVLGDSAGHDLTILSRCLHLFDRFGGQKLCVAGNHELWTTDGDSLDRYENQIPAICRDAGFHYLDDAPSVIGRVGFVGSIGWYDYSFRCKALGVPMRFYEHKVGPGAAARLPKHEALLADDADVPPEAMQIGARWMDGEFVYLPAGDVEFCRRLRDKLDAHLKEVAPRVDTIVVGIHHIPFSDMARTTGDASWDFAAAFLGSGTFGELFMRHPKVAYVFCGHNHRPGRLSRQHLTCINIGSTYRHKRYEVIELDETLL